MIHLHALVHGDLELIYTTTATGLEPDAGMIAFERETSAGDYALVVINAQGDHPSSMSEPSRRQPLVRPVGFPRATNIASCCAVLLLLGGHRCAP